MTNISLSESLAARLGLPQQLSPLMKDVVPRENLIPGTNIGITQRFAEKLGLFKEEEQTTEGE